MGLDFSSFSDKRILRNLISSYGKYLPWLVLHINMDDNLMKEIGRNCKDLIHLSIEEAEDSKYSDNEQVSLEGIDSLFKGCKKLQEINLKNLKYKGNPLQIILKECSELLSLNIYSGFKISGDCFSNIRGSKQWAKHLTQVSLVKVSVNDESVCSLVKQCTNLQVLSIGLLNDAEEYLGQTNVTDISMRAIAKYSKNLRILQILSCRVTGDGLVALSEAEQCSLKKLQFIGCPDIGKFNSTSSRYCQLPSVSSLLIKLSPLKDDDIRNICRMFPNLKKISLQSLEELSGKSIQYLSRYNPKLRYIKIKNDVDLSACLQWELFKYLNTLSLPESARHLGFDELISILCCCPMLSQESLSKFTCIELEQMMMAEFTRLMEENHQVPIIADLEIRAIVSTALLLRRFFCTMNSQKAYSDIMKRFGDLNTPPNEYLNLSKEFFKESAEPTLNELMERVISECCIHWIQARSGIMSVFLKAISISTETDGSRCSAIGKISLCMKCNFDMMELNEEKRVINAN
jgi:hypothetical protein